MLKQWMLACAAAALGIAAPPLQAAMGESELDRLLSLSLEELGQLEVTSASMHADPLSEVVASVFVIHGSTIRASGARSLPEALALAPNLQVARTDARGFAISARGMKTTLSNKLLVLVDGRPIYTPLFSGVLWDQKDTLLEDIDRIEVISGPGAASWGSNAMNGVINVITRSAAATVGGYASAYGGQDGHGAAVRQGWNAGEAGAVRLYARHGEFDATETADGLSVGDGWTHTQVGARSDWQLGRGTLTVQGDTYRAESDPRPSGAVEVSGFNLLSRWAGTLSSGSDLQVQAFFDMVDRDDPLVLFDRTRRFDLDVQHTRQLGQHLLVLGGGYRRAEDDSMPGLFTRLLPAAETLDWASLFAETMIALDEDLELDLGLRLEHNDYTGTEWLPSVRLGWSASPHAFFWGSASRAVRAPARFDRDFFLPADEPFIIRGGPGFRSEVANVLEFGYRGQPTGRLAVSATVFHHWLDRLRAGRPAPTGGVEIANGVEGELYGAEAWATWRASGEWEIGLGLMALRKDLRLSEGFADPNAISDQGNDPEHQAMLRLIRNLPGDQQLFLMLRHVAELPDPGIPSYTSLDTRWSWRPVERVELGIRAENLLDKRHAEFEPRAGYAQSVFGRSLGADLRIYW